MTGAVVTSAHLVRLRVVGHNDMDDISEGFDPQAADALAIFPLRLEELI
jgi:hypothetical protein